MLGQRVLQPFTHTQHLLGLDFNLRGLAEALVDGRLVDEHAGVRQHQTFAFGAGGQQDGRGRGGLAEAYGLHVRLDVLHGVVDGGHGRHGTARRIDVHHHVTVRILTFQNQQLGHDVIGGGVVHLHAHEDDAILEQAGVRILPLVSVRGLFLELRQNVTVLRCERGLTRRSPLEADHTGRSGQTFGAGYKLCFFACHGHSPLVALIVSWVETSLSTKPYSNASWAVNQWSYSLSR